MGETGFLAFGNYPGDLVTGYITDPKGDLIRTGIPYREFLLGRMHVFHRPRPPQTGPGTLYGKADEEGNPRADVLSFLQPRICFLRHLGLSVSAFAPTTQNWWKDVVAFSDFSVCSKRFIEDNYTLIILSNNDRFQS